MPPCNNNGRGWKNKQRRKSSNSGWTLLAKEAFDDLSDWPGMSKYWPQRHQLFSRFDKGIKMDCEGWYSVTPEKNAVEIAYRMVQLGRHEQRRNRDRPVILDGFAGVGGNAIQFASAGAKVIAVDIDGNRLKCARANAKVYGVENSIDFIQCDLFSVLRMLEFECRPIDAIFLSPPWGGLSYCKNGRKFDLDRDLRPVGATELLEATSRVSSNIAFYIPRNSPIDQIPAFDAGYEVAEVEPCFDLNGNLKALVAYYGSLKIWNRSEAEEWQEAKRDISQYYHSIQATKKI